MLKFLALLCTAMVLSACNSPAPTTGEIVGRWQYYLQGSEEPNDVEVRLGRIIFRDDGTFEATNVNGVVLKLNSAAPVSGRGTWVIHRETSPLRQMLDRPSLTLIYDEHGIPFRVYFSHYQGQALLTFSRDEEAGEWVKYRRVD